MGGSIYLDALSKFGVGGAHPGGLNLTKEMFKDVKMNNTSHVLDVGCGTGQTAAYLATHFGAKVTGIDINPIMVEKARNRMEQSQLPVEIIQGSIENCPLMNETFDFIISESVLSFVNKPKALKEIYRLLKKGGLFFANEMTINKPLTAMDEAEIRQFYGLDSILQKKEWIALFEHSGFINIRTYKNKTPVIHNQSMPDLHVSKYIEPKHYAILNEHFNIIGKYQAILDYRIFSCMK
ncbi:class I SAM-dependent methyltransferase [Bacillus sp. Bva_UNVM-123]|uniref:class I SAM-dependent methyltransferase n=1 Tax=Bacillus sp. Bva_UNVM-123 TaxID=2829798 RepID=UPI00391FABF4